MSVEGGPDIVNDGLVLYLDAGNTKSYPGSGTTWKDLSGNGNDGTLYNGTSFNSSEIKTMVFDGVDDGIESTFTNNPFANSFTAELFFYVSEQNQDHALLMQDASTTSPNKFFILYPSFNNLSFRIVDENQTRYRNFRGSLTTDQWYHACLTVDFDNNQLISYRDTVGSSPVDITNFSGTISNNLYIGDSRGPGGGTRSPLNGGISQVRIYNRALTSQEILQNYKATKGRYGL